MIGDIRKVLIRKWEALDKDKFRKNLKCVGTVGVIIGAGLIGFKLGTAYCKDCMSVSLKYIHTNYSEK